MGESQLRQWAEKSAAGEAVPDDVMSLVQSILDQLKRIMEATQKEHENDVGILNSAKASFDKCSSAAAEALAGVVNSNAIQAGHHRQDHTSCRVAEENALDAKNAA